MITRNEMVNGIYLLVLIVAEVAVVTYAGSVFHAGEAVQAAQQEGFCSGLRVRSVGTDITALIKQEGCHD